MTRCKVILPRKAYRQGEQCQKRALNPSVGLCETHLAKVRRDSERKMLADIERDRAAKAKREAESGEPWPGQGLTWSTVYL